MDGLPRRTAQSSCGTPPLGTYWSAADIAIQHVSKEIGGLERIKGKKIALLFHDSPYGKEPIPALLALAHKYSFEFRSMPVPHPGLEQEPQWRTIRQDKVDYVLLWGWGAMNSATIKQAAAAGYPRDRMIGVWWSGADADVKPVGDEAVGYKALMLQHGFGKFAVHAAIERYVYAKRKGAGKAEEIGELLYNRGLIGAMLGVEGIHSREIRQKAPDRRTKPRRGGTPPHPFFVIRIGMNGTGHAGSSSHRPLG
jgi:branched-chain amino acid transport system substrate-binding protein